MLAFALFSFVRILGKVEMAEFTLDKRLKADCLAVTQLKLCQLLLMDDSRWPWLILVPQINDMAEIHHLEFVDQDLLQREISQVAKILAAVSECEKINIGALGNIVRQLHIHIIARNRGDANWPGPVWGYGQRQPYERDGARKLIDLIRKGVS